MTWLCPECESPNHDSLIRCVCGFELRNESPNKNKKPMTGDSNTLGITSFTISIIALILFFALWVVGVYISISMESAFDSSAFSTVVGLIFFALFFGTIIGIVLGILGIKRKESTKSLSKRGLIINSVLFFILIAHIFFSIFLVSRSL